MVDKVKGNKNEFLEFLKKYNVIELATAFILGGAAKDLVNSIANDMIMPVIGILSPDGSWRSISFTIAGAEFKVGNLLGNLLNFLIIAVVVFVVLKKIFRIEDAESKKGK